MLSNFNNQLSFVSIFVVLHSFSATATAPETSGLSHLKTPIECQLEWNTDNRLTDTARCISEDSQISECATNSCFVLGPSAPHQNQNPKDNKTPSDMLEFHNCQKFVGRWGDLKNLNPDSISIKVIRYWGDREEGSIIAVALDDATKEESGFHCPQQSIFRQQSTRISCNFCKSVVGSKLRPRLANIPKFMIEKSITVPES